MDDLGPWRRLGGRGGDLGAVVATWRTRRAFPALDSRSGFGRGITCATIATQREFESRQTDQRSRAGTESEIRRPTPRLTSRCLTAVPDAALIAKAWSTVSEQQVDSISLVVEVGELGKSVANATKVNIRPQGWRCLVTCTCVFVVYRKYVCPGRLCLLPKWSRHLLGSNQNLTTMKTASIRSRSLKRRSLVTRVFTYGSTSLGAMSLITRIQSLSSLHSSQLPRAPGLERADECTSLAKACAAGVVTHAISSPSTDPVDMQVLYICARDAYNSSGYPAATTSMRDWLFTDS